MSDQTNVIPPFAEPAGQHEAKRAAFEKWFYDFRDFATPSMFRLLIDGRRYESMETECAWQGYLAGIATLAQESFVTATGHCKRWCGDGECKDKCISPSKVSAP